MKIKNIMTKNVEIVQAGDPIQKAAKKMLRRDVGALPVFSNGRLAGVVTDRDITVKAVAKGLNLSKAKVEAVMTRRAQCCQENETVEKAVKAMERKKIRRLLVVDPEHRLAGIVSLADLALRTHKARLVEEVVEKICKPGHAK